MKPDNIRRVSEKGVALIKHFEGLRLNAYQCSAGVWTIGYGHTTHVRPGDVVSEEQADFMLRQDITESERCVNRYVTAMLTQFQFDALVSFTFNLGGGNLHNSTLLKKINAGDFAGAVQQFSRWVYAGGVKSPGLVRRREAEKRLFECKKYVD